MSHLPNSFLVTQIYNYFHSTQTHKHQNSFIMKTFSRLCITNTHLNEQEKRSKHHTPTSEAMLQKKAERSGLTFWAEAEVSVGALKTKSCLSVSEFFLFSGNTCRSSPKSADGEFSLFRFFCSGKRNEMPLRHEQQQSDKALAALEQKSIAQQKAPLRRLSKKPSGN